MQWKLAHIIRGPLNVRKPVQYFNPSDVLPCTWVDTYAWWPGVSECVPSLPRELEGTLLLVWPKPPIINLVIKTSEKSTRNMMKEEGEAGWKYLLLNDGLWTIHHVLCSISLFFSLHTLAYPPGLINLCCQIYVIVSRDFLLNISTITSIFYITVLCPSNFLHT